MSQPLTLNRKAWSEVSAHAGQERAEILDSILKGPLIPVAANVGLWSRLIQRSANVGVNLRLGASDLIRKATKIKRVSSNCISIAVPNRKEKVARGEAAVKAVLQTVRSIAFTAASPRAECMSTMVERSYVTQTRSMWPRCVPPLAQGFCLMAIAFAVLAAAILSREAVELSDFDQRFYTTIAYDMDRYGVFSNGTLDDVDSVVSVPPPGMFFGPVY